MPYFSTSSSVNARLVKVDLKTFRRVGAIVMDQLESPLRTAVMDPAGRYAYFGAGSCPACSIVKVDLATFSRAHAVPVGRNGNLTRAVIDPAGNFAYFGQLGSGNGTTSPTLPARIVKVALNRAPNLALAVAADDYATDYATPLTVPAPGVLANDGPGLAAGQASDPAGGSVVLRPDGSFTYTPDQGFSGTDTFTYTASDGADYSVPATVSVAVAPPKGPTGSAYGFFSSVSLFGGPSETRGPAPTVTLPAEGSTAPVTATAPTGDAVYGPAKIFTSGQLDVSTQGTTGSVTSSATVANVNRSLDEKFTAAEVASTCTATASGVSASTKITSGVLQTSEGDPNVDGDETNVTGVAPLQRTGWLW